MIIALDVDGPCAQLMPEVLKRYNADYDDAVQMEDIKSWDAHLYVKPECGPKLYDYFRNPDLYDAIQPTPGVEDAVETLRIAGHEVFFVTTNTFHMTDQKASWLLRHKLSRDEHPFFLPEDLIVTRQKNLVDAHILIDDRASYIRDWVEGKRRHAILFEMPWNSHLLDDVPSAFWSWCDRASRWSQILLTLLDNGK